MSRSQPNRPKLRSNAEWLAIVADIAAGTAAAREAAVAILRREVGDHVEYVVHLPVAWIDRSAAARRTIARLVVERLEADEFDVVKEWRNRALRCRDHATFATMLKTVILYVALHHAARAEPLARDPPITPSSARDHRDR